MTQLTAGNFDVVETDADHHVRMKTISEFFGLTQTKGSSMNWTYTGHVNKQRVLRQIDCFYNFVYYYGWRSPAWSRSLF